MKGFEKLSRGLYQTYDKIYSSPVCSDGTVIFMGYKQERE